MVLESISSLECVPSRQRRSPQGHVWASDLSSPLTRHGTIVT
jgi:hypothetical protein